jgi:Zn-dependent protease with chaperone function
LLLPIILVEARYARTRLNLTLGQAFRVFAVANVISTVIGFPLATLAANIFQIKVQNQLYGNPQLNFEQWSRSGDPSNLARGFGQYPHGPLFAAAGLMFFLCFLISWWIEAAYVNWWIARKSLGTPAVKSHTTSVVRNANVLSYVLLAAISIGLLARMSR